jgi:hypothetical protein
MKGLTANKPIFFNWARITIGTDPTVSYTTNADTTTAKPNIICADLST